MRQALYRKYRSRSFGEVVGQEHITQTLQSALKSGRISHAYLFTGPRGVGKTSVARILAHEVNQIPYEGEAVHLDIIEIDAASNRRIDEIRDLRERVRIAPTSAKFKVYIIDEVHMLTREAFNALLKTLEEPPAHVIFILATTEAHKLPETIVSRTQRFEFKPIGQSAAAGHLNDIAKREKIDIDKQALELLADFGRGSFRDSISYLDQLSSRTGKITADDVRAVLGLPPAAEINMLVSNIRSGDSKQALANLQTLQGQGVEAVQTAAALATEIRNLAIAGQADRALISLLRQLIEVPSSLQPYDYLEVSVLEASQQNHGQASQPDNSRQPPKADKNHQPSSNQHDKAKHQPVKPAAATAGFDISRWDEVIDRAKDEAASIYTALRLAKPQLEDDVLVLKFQFPLHQKKLTQSKNKEMVSSLIQSISGLRPPIRCEVDKAAFETVPAETAEPDPAGQGSLSSINNIFGGAEVLES